MFNTKQIFSPATFFKGLAFLFIAGFAGSCVSPKKLTENAVYFRNTSDSALNATALSYEATIQKGDILYIGVLTANEASSQLFNQQNFYAGAATGAANIASNPAIGYLVDENGMISFPTVGQISVSGMKKTVLSEMLTKKVREYVSDAVLSVRVLNFKVTVLGEVANPGSFSIPSERVNILDVIGLAGDLTVFGRRDNVRIIREVNGKLESGIIDLNQGQVFSSPYYYLRQNDIVYVEMNNRKMVNADQTNSRNLSLALGALSAISLIITLATRFNN